MSTDQRFTEAPPHFPLNDVLGVNTMIAAAYVLTGLLSLDLHAPNSIAPMIYLPSGIAVIAVYFLGLRILPGILLGALALVLYQGAEPNTVRTAIGFAMQVAIGATEAAVAAVVFRLFARHGRPDDLSFGGMSVLLLGAAAGALIGGVLGAPSLWVNGFLPLSLVPVTTLNWALADLLGILAVFPILAAFKRHGWKIPDNHAVELAAASILFIPFVYLHFDGPLYIFPVFIFLLLSLWLSLRVESVYTPLITTLLACAVVVGEAKGLDHFKTQEHVANINAYCFALILSSLIVRILKQRLETEYALRRSVELEVEARRIREEKLRHIALHDQLTGLPTRTLCLDHLTKALASAKRKNLKAAVLFIDLDGFKAVNDTRGHQVGDKLLLEVGRRLTEAVRAVDTVSRAGGDEFLIVLTDINDRVDAAFIAEKLVDALGLPFVIDGRPIEIGGSVGIALYPDDALDADGLIDHADAAMYGVKKAGKGAFAFSADHRIRA